MAASATVSHGSSRLRRCIIAIEGVVQGIGFRPAVYRLAVSHGLLILVTFRPEFSAPWIGRPHVTALTLNRLTRRDIDSLIEGVVGTRSLPARIRQDIIERTDGIPLFAEEITKAVLDAEGESDAQRTFAGAPTPVVTVPASLQASLMSRLDRLGPAKDVAQVAAAIGRNFLTRCWLPLRASRRWN